MIAVTAEHDVIVVGSGGAGLVAACAAADRGARVLVLEVADHLGGTTALSGGQMWLPDTNQMRRAGYDDSRRDARTYLDRVTLGATPTAELDAFLDHAPRLADYLEDDLGIALCPVPRPDYHPGWDGARFGRSLEPAPVSTTELGPLRDRLLTSPTRPPLTATESRTGVPPDVLRARRAADVRTQGSGLVAGLVRACLRRGVELRTGVRVVGLAHVPTGRAVTVQDRDGDRTAMAAAASVIVACGGFAHNASMRRDLLPPLDALPLSVPTCIGDGIILGLAAGGRIRGAGEAWWTPATRLPAEAGRPVARNIVRELALPGSILVNRDGRRFADEASSYNDLGKAFLRFDTDDHTFPDSTAWLVFDAEFAASRTVAGAAPGDPRPAGLVTASDLEALADRLHVDSTTLATTVATINAAAGSGVDREFGRGSNPHDRYNGDPDHRPNPCLGRLETPPFHALPISLGLNGTKTGLVTSTDGAVLDPHGQPLPGLFACGESAAALMGPGYAGNGAALGPGLSTALVAGAAAVGRPASTAHPRA